MSTIITLIVTVSLVWIAIYGFILFVMGMSYGYWVLSIGMAPVLWLLMAVGVAVGFVCAVKNALKAAGAVWDEMRA